MLIWYTGALFGLTPFSSYFIDYVKSDIHVKDVTKVYRSIGIGTTIQNFVDVNGTNFYLSYVSYHLMSLDARLFTADLPSYALWILYWPCSSRHNSLKVSRYQDSY